MELEPQRDSRECLHRYRKGRGCYDPAKHEVCSFKKGRAGISSCRMMKLLTVSAGMSNRQ